MNDNTEPDAGLAREIYLYGDSAYSPRDFSSAALEVVRARRGARRAIRWMAFSLAGLTAVAASVLVTALLSNRTPVTPGTVTPMEQADRLFADQNTCNAEIAGHSIEVPYPAGWWAYPGADGSPACLWLAPHALSIPTPLTARPTGTVITIGAVGGGPAITGEPLSSQSMTVAGRVAQRVETTAGSDVTGRAATYYWIPMGEHGDGPTLVITTSDEPGADYVLNKAILDRLVQDLRIH